MGGSRQGLQLSFMEWLTILFILTSTGISVAAYAFTHFEAKEDADKRELRLNDGIKELRINMETFMQESGVKYQKLPSSQERR